MESGIHELTAGYALDALDPDEKRSYEGHLDGCEQCREELSSFWETTAALALATKGPEPSAELRRRILAGARAEPQNVVPFRRRPALPAGVTPLRAVSALAAVAAVAAVALGTWAVSLHGRLGTADDRLATDRGNLSVLSDPTARTVSLAKGSGHLVVASGGRAVMVLDGLDRAPAGKTYEVWVIKGTTPERAGLFAGGGRSVVGVDGAVGNDAVVAVTLERSGGVDAPTTTPLVASQPV
jgi:anti-sigma-K factor RskA